MVGLAEPHIFETTLLQLITAIQDAASSDREAFTVLQTIINDGRIRMSSRLPRRSSPSWRCLAPALRPSRSSMTIELS
jgi:hypothetical protein